MSWMKRAVVTGSIIATVVGGAVLVRDRATQPTFRTEARLDGRTVLVTGANTGLGRQTALECARRGARVIMACRDMTKCEEARKYVVLESSNQYVYCKHCDLASQRSVRRFAEAFNKTEPRLDVLVNNAGVMRCPRRTTLEGIELQLGVNHMGHFLLTSLLLDKLKHSAPARVVNLVSVAHRRGCLNFNDLNSEKEYSSVRAYNDSQLANMLFTLELARRLEGSGVTCNAVHPGLTATQLNRHMTIHTSWLASIVVKPLQMFVLRSPEQGAQAILYAAADPAVADRSGEYISDCEGTAVGELALSRPLAARMWATSERWTGLAAAEGAERDSTPASRSASTASSRSASTAGDARPAAAADTRQLAADLPGQTCVAPALS